MLRKLSIALLIAIVAQAVDLALSHQPEFLIPTLAVALAALVALALIRLGRHLEVQRAAREAEQRLQLETTAPPQT